MEWYRSWPKYLSDYDPKNPATPTVLPPHLAERPYVVDTMTKLFMHSWDYATVESWPNESFCMLEWDIALDRQARERFETYVSKSPGEVWAARYHLSDDRLIFGLGCIYFPIDVLRAFLATDIPATYKFTDHTFYKWCISNGVRVWESHGVYPQHLNT